MTEIKHIKHGDLVILSTGEEAIADGIIEYNEEKQRYRIEYNKPVTGWPRYKQLAWWYNEDGTFVRASYDTKNCTNIVKVIHNGSDQS